MSTTTSTTRPPADPMAGIPTLDDLTGPGSHVPTPRTKNPVSLVPGAFKQLMALGGLVKGQGVDEETLELVHQRVSQINGCAGCLLFGLANARKLGMTTERLTFVAAWREAPCYTEVERAALGLAEAMTRLADSADGVPDDVWDEAARHFDERALSALVLAVATTNMINRVNATTRQVPGII